MGVEAIACTVTSSKKSTKFTAKVREGEQVAAGQRFGVMKFGSRMDVFLPAGSTIHTQVGAKVVGGVTVIATLPARS